MKILCTIALLAMGITLPGCVRSLGFYDAVGKRLARNGRRA